MKLVRFQEKQSENRLGILIENTRIVEITGQKGSEPVLDFLQDPKRETKAAQAPDAKKPSSSGTRSL